MSAPDPSRHTADQRRALLARLLEQRLREPRTAPTTAPQQRLWFLEQMLSGAPAYTIGRAFRLTGRLDLAALEQALADVIRRHEPLRTTFVAQRGEPVCVIAPEPKLGFRGVGARETPEEAKRLAEDEVHRPFDLATGPLFRVLHLRTGETESVLVFSVHHIVFDGGSLDVLFRELSTAYRARVAGSAPSLPALSTSFSEIARREREGRDDARVKEGLSYFLQKLAGPLPALQIPADRPRPAVFSHRGARRSFALGEPLTEALRGLGQGEGATLFMTLLAGFAALLHRYTGQADIVIGSPSGTRDRMEAEGLIGFFVNTLVLRIDLAGEPTFRELVARVRRTVLEAFVRRDVPFEALVKALEPERDLGRAPLVQTLFALQTEASAPLGLEGIESSPLELDGRCARLDLSLAMEASDQGLSGVVEYATDLFDAATIYRMIGHLRSLLEGAAANPDARIAELQLLTEEERWTLSAGWNDTEAPYPRDTPIHRLFEAQVTRAPGATAVIFGETRLTYEELNRRANRLAHHLRSLGVGPGTLVGLHMERSAAWIVALVAVLKAGGAYVPLDVDLPAARLALLLEDTKLPVALTDRADASLPPGIGARLIRYQGSRGDEALAGERDDDLDSDAGALDLAYVMYTSGSTGRPKGVCVPHRAVSRLVLGTNYVRISPSDRIAQASNGAFDAATFEIWGALLNGACVVGVPRDVVLAPARFAEALRADRIDVLFLTTALFHRIADEDPRAFAPLRDLLVGGDFVDPRRVRAVLAAGPPGRFFDVYGPTESTTFATYHEVTSAPPEGPIPIGRPISNTRVYVLDAHMDLAPIGVPGELFIAGDGLALGYLGRPDLTAERFVDAPRDIKSGERLYRTGDRARWRSDGRLEMLGRADDQVKIRGFRVEPAEIEEALMEHPEVTGAKVVASPGAQGDKRLIAYVIARGGVDRAASLRAFVRARLPEYMVPSAFIALDGWPLDENGKIDRARLPLPEAPATDRAEGEPLPRTAVEELLAEVWADLLGVGAAGRHESFFDLGGHSLLATRMLSRVREVFGVDLPVRAAFERPVLADLAAAIEEARRRGEESPQLRISPAPRGEDLPLSFAQQRLWFLDRLDAAQGTYNIPLPLRARGPLRRDVLARSFEALIARHEALRTSFIARGGEAAQVIAPPAPFDLPVIDLGGLAVDDAEAEVRRLAVEEAKRPFDLTRGPMVRARLLRLHDTEHVLLVNVHHIASDGWSMGVFLRELSTLYSDFSAGREASLAALPIQYVDFAVWQRRWLEGGVLDAQLAHWTERLRGPLPTLDLPSDRPRPPLQSHRGAHLSFTLSRALSDGLRGIARREGATLFMTLLAGFMTLLHRHTGQDDLLVGTPVANRRLAETEGLIGFFVNTLVLRGDLRGAPAFREVVARVRDAALDAYAHQDIPFERLVEALHPERDLSRSPLFQVMFILQNAPLSAPELPGLELTPFEVESGGSKFDLTLALRETGEGLRGSLEYSTDLFEPASMQRLVERLRILLEGAVARPDASILDLPVTTAEERALLERWNDTVADFPADACVHELFAAQAARTPDAVALLFEEEHITYRDLHARSSRLAARLRALGVGPDVLVGIAAERSPEAVIGVLAVLEAGGAFVPLDPTYPRDRLAFMLEDSGAPIVLTQARLAGGLPEHRGRTVLIDGEDGEQTDLAPARAARRVTASDTAYVIYTSGSTGKPKGAIGTHLGIANRCFWMWQAYPFEPGEVGCQKTTLSFVDSMWEIFGPLLRGTPSVIIPDAVSRDLPRFVRTLAARRVTRIVLVPSLLRALLDTEPDLAEKLPALRHWTSSGEALSAELHDRFRRALPGRVLLNLYGSSEVTADATCFEAGSSPWEGKVPIGRPIANTQTYVLDARREPVPIGVQGEIYVGGAGVARGYLHRPELDAERFVRDPFSARPGARLFKTGDLGRWLPDGNLEYLGRADDQVKIRGQRIELGDVEAALGQHASVREACVSAREGGDGDTRLVAYVVWKEGALSAAAALREHLESKLPAHMVPSAFVALDALPRSPNGKVDRKALPAPGEGQSEGAHVAPRTAMEELVAGLFADLLGRTRVSAGDDFFALGGHSLLAMQLMARIAVIGGVDLPLRALFEAPTVEKLASRIGAAREAELPPLSPVPRGGPLRLSFAQRRLWFLDRLDPGSASYNISFGLRLTGNLDREALRGAFEALVARHEALRTRFALVDEEAAQIIEAPPAWDLPLTDLSPLPASERAEAMRRLSEREARAPFDLDRSPLLRAALLRLDALEHVVIVTLHHIASDGWSLGVLLHELSMLYSDLAAGRPPSLAPLPIQYADFAAWQRRWLEGPVLDAQLAYWTARLRGPLPTLDLPCDHPRPPVPSHRGARVAFTLPRQLAGALRALARREGATLFMVLLAGFMTLLHRHTDQEDLLVGTPVANRRHPDTEGLIGFFVNTLVLRADLGGAPTFRALLARVRDSALDAYAHQDIPFEKLVEALQPDRDASRAPLFQAMFILQNAPLSAPELPGLQLTPLDVESGTSKFDIALALRESGEGLRGALEYSTDLFEAASMRRFVERFRILLEGAAAAPDTPIAALPLSSEAERATLLGAWNDTQAEVASDVCVHHLFEAQAARTPDAPAILFEDQRITYRELDLRSSRVAHHLSALGVGRETLVGVCIERSPEVVVAILGALKAGGAYLPLDSSHPPERLAALLEESGAAVLLTHSALAGRLPASRAKVVCVDALPPFEEGALARVGVSPDDLAYCIYTSGSTGKPKGVEVSHRNLMCSTAARFLHYREAVKRFLWLSPVAFDSSIAGLFWTLSQGGALVIPPEGAQADLGVLSALIERHGVSHLLCIPSFYRQVLDHAETSSLGSLRTVIVAGEACPRELLTRHRAFLPACSFVNEYGPTEGTVWCSAYDGDALEPDQPVPIGRPIANARLHVLDSSCNLAPIGVAGELYLGGAGVARGYRDRPDLTAERFVPDPFSSEPGARMYRTGDRARHRPDGALEYLGRVDHQVKIRGFRVELGEIEAALSEHPSVREALVLAREHTAGDARLVAYVLSSDDTSIAALRDHLGSKLPAYMVPSAFVLLDAWPLNRNGKVDREALPAPEERPSTLEHVPPRTAMEELVAGLFAELLGRAQVGAGDDFFALGGHSLLAMQLMARIGAVGGVVLPLRALFEAPTVEALAARISAARGAGREAELPPLVAAPREGRLPLSFAQQRLLFLDRLEPGSASYNVPAALRLSGRLDREALRGAFEALVERHEALRTRFALADGRASQIIDAPPDWELAFTSLASRPAGEQGDEVLRVASEEARRPFDLGRGPVLRTTLLGLDEGEHVLLVTVHHIAFDGWSMGVFLRELSALYSALVEGRSATLAPLPIQYADFAHWQRRWLEGGVIESQLGYWTETLRGPLPTLDLLGEHPRPPVPSYRGAHLAFALSESLSADLRALGRREGATLFMVLLAGFMAVLHRHTEQDDLLVGTPVANRRHPATEGLIGFFVNTLVLRGDLGCAPTFRGLLARMRDTALDAYAHQDMPFEKLVEALQPERDPSRSPLFQVMLVLQNAPVAAMEVPDLHLLPIEVENGISKLDLTLTLRETGEGLQGSLEYSTDLFEAASMHRLIEHLRILLEGAVATPDAQIASLPMLSGEEQATLLGEWNDARAARQDDICVHELFEEQVKRAPGSVAVFFGEEGLTYRELDMRANRVACHLRALGVGAGVLVGICVERSPEVVVAILGTLKAGGAYLPLDPSSPRERLASLLEDSGATVLLTQTTLLDRLSSSKARVVCLDMLPFFEEREYARAKVSPDDLAYCIYTSGSTGKPKSVEVTHRNLTSSTRARFQHYREAVKRFLWLSPVAFDSSIAGLFWTLCQGGALVIPPEGAQADLGVLSALIEGHEVSHLLCIPSFYRHILARLGAGPLRSLRTVIVAGETCPRELLAQHRATLPACSFVNEYGPTEGTVWCSAYEGDALEPDQPVPIGRPIAGARLHVLDSSYNLAPIGAAGELYLGGAGVARAYRGRPELTAERFVPDPFSREPGARMYRTGDRARHRPDGALEYLGRVDHQVKIRGFRVELGEIEAALSEHPSVREALVLARADVPGDPRIVAHVLSNDGASTAMLREHLGSRLPAYMVPSAFVFLDAWPLNPNGKVDRRALPAPEEEARLTRDDALPRTETEATLAALWAEVLRVPHPGIHDDFFESGGHSLLSIELLSRVHQALGVEIPLRAFFDAPTVAGLASIVSALSTYQSGSIAAARPPDLAADAILDATIAPQRPRSNDSTAPEHILLTGATGFLGAFLLRELLERTEAHIHCLVRAPSEGQAMRRIERSLASHGLWEDRLSARIHPVPGDLSRSRLGLTESDFDALSASIDVIYHNGAEVSAVYPYARLRRSNVLGTTEVLRLACRGEVKPVHYVSTLSVFSRADAFDRSVLHEDDEPERAHALESGYSQSKWVAEHLVVAARGRGVPVSIYRPGHVAGHSITGTGATDDLINRLIKGCVQLGCAPAVDTPLGLTPVDYTARALVELSLRPQQLGGTYHLVNQRAIAWSAIVARLRAAGYAISDVPYEAWQRALAGAGPENALTPVASLFARPREERRAPRFDDRRTREGLAGSEIACPPPDDALVDRYVAALIRSGFLAVPGE